MRDKNQPKSTGVKFLADLATHLTPALTITGLILFVVLSMLYENYFFALGAAPSDVGIGYIETLAFSYGYVAILGVGSVILFLLFWGVSQAFKKTSDRREKAGQPHGRGARINAIGKRFVSRHPLAITVLYVTLFGLFLGYNLIDVRVQEDVGRLILTGRPVSPYRWCSLTFLDIRAQEATLGPGTDALLIRSYKGHTLRYLGVANRLYILYDVTARRVVRFSVEKAFLATSPLHPRKPC
ncbi:hypothetical protein ACFCYX_09485 [Streptomyces populi]|uniref:hypothetical protein n=1 Tax=Streptomyces populi TaxID=2058924 RepID=UPI0035D5C87A